MNRNKYLLTDLLTFFFFYFKILHINLLINKKWFDSWQFSIISFQLPSHFVETFHETSPTVIDGTFLSFSVQQLNNSTICCLQTARTQFAPEFNNSTSVPLTS